MLSTYIPLVTHIPFKPMWQELKSQGSEQMGIDHQQQVTDRGASLSPCGVGCQSGLSSRATGHSKGQGREVKGSLPPLASAPEMWEDTVKQCPKCGRQYSGGLKWWNQSTPHSSSYIPGLEIPTILLEEKQNLSSKPSCGSYCFYSPTLTH